MDNRVTSLARRRALIAVRLNRPQEGELVAQRAGALRFGLYASARGAVAEDAPLCGLLDEGFTLPEVAWPQSLGRPFSFQSNSLLGVRAAVRAGLGIALLPHFRPTTIRRCNWCARCPRSCARSGSPTLPNSGAPRASGP